MERERQAKTDFEHPAQALPKFFSDPLKKSPAQVGDAGSVGKTSAGLANSLDIKSNIFPPDKFKR
jgi:hypothetical protein